MRQCQHLQLTQLLLRVTEDSTQLRAPNREPFILTEVAGTMMIYAINSTLPGPPKMRGPFSTHVLTLRTCHKIS